MGLVTSVMNILGITFMADMLSSYGLDFDFLILQLCVLASSFAARNSVVYPSA